MTDTELIQGLTALDSSPLPTDIIQKAVIAIQTASRQLDVGAWQRQPIILVLDKVRRISHCLDHCMV